MSKNSESLYNVVHVRTPLAAWYIALLQSGCVVFYTDKTISWGLFFHSLFYFV